MPEQQKVAQDFVMSKNSLILVLQNKQENSTIDMAKIHIKSEKLTPFGGIFLGHGAIWLRVAQAQRVEHYAYAWERHQRACPHGRYLEIDAEDV